jgi:hypothetical protein
VKVNFLGFNDVVLSVIVNDPVDSETPVVASSISSLPAILIVVEFEYVYS